MWLTGLGLAIGMGMIVGLLSLIVVRGLEVFWPQRVVELTLREEAESALGGRKVLAGEVVRKQLRANDGAEEWQFFVGNRELYQTSFHWVLAEEVESLREPKEVIKLERQEYGDVIGYPLRLQGPEGVVSATEAMFRTTLGRRVKQVQQERAAVVRMEKDKMGAINRRLAWLERRYREDKPSAYETEKAELRAEYEKLATEIRERRAALEKTFLVYRTASGEERELPLGQVISYYFPNDLNFWGRLGVFLRQGWEFLTAEPREANTEGGIFPALFGTFAMTVLMSIFVTPLGVVAAIYLREYAKQGSAVKLVRICVNNLAGVPSIVFGVFGLGFFVYGVGGKIDEYFFASTLPTPTFGTGGIMWAAMTLALLTLPVVIVATEEALAAVPRGIREAALACGASKWQMIQRVVLPSAAPGVLTGVILAMARGAGEVAPLMIVGVVKLAPSLPIDGVFPFIHPERKFMHLGFHIYDLGFQSPDSEAAKPMVFATTLLLITLVVVMNLTAILLRTRLRQKYAASTF